jgi:MFS family permease
MIESAAQDAAGVQPWTLYTEGQRWRLLAILFLVSTSNYFDRNVISVLLEPIKHEFHVSDTMLGVLSGFCFAIFYAVFGVPVARWADRGNRRTIITLALSVWSVMTICCGLAQNFWQLSLSRIGVGAGESGAIPPAQSLIADYFPPDRRASAIAIFMSSAMAGYLLGFGAGGYIAATYGWRAAFLLGGVPGLVLALVTRFGLTEPRQRVGGHQGGDADHERFRETLAHLKAKRAFLYALIGCILFFFVAYGALVFAPSFLIRVLHVPLATVSLASGTLNAVGSVVGTLGGGWVADRLGRRDIRWLAWLPAAACALAAPIYAVAFSFDHLGGYLGLSFAAGILVSGGLPPVFAAIHAVCGSRRRAMAIAIVLFSGTLFGGGLGPLAAGAISDALSAVYGANGLRYMLMLMMPLLVVTGGFYYLAGRALPADLED